MAEKLGISSNIKSKKGKISPIPDLLYLPKLVNNRCSFN